MYQRRYNSLGGNGQRVHQYTPPATPIPPVAEVIGPATALSRLRQALLVNNPDLEGRMDELHSAFSARHITLKEYWEGLQELRRDYGRKQR